MGWRQALAAVVLGGALAAPAAECAACAVASDRRVVYRHDLMTADGWSVKSYEGRTPGTFGGEWLGLKGLVIVADFTNQCDTAWGLSTKRIAIGNALSVRLSLETYAERHYYGGVRRRRAPGAWARWFDAAGRELAATPLGIVVPAGRSDLCYEGEVPAGARALQLEFSVDSPDLRPGERLVFANFQLEVSEAQSSHPLELVGAERLQFEVPLTTVRDDGVTLIDGQPFFPIGIYGLTRNDFNGHSFDTMLRQLKEIGFNFGLSYSDRHSRELQETAERQDFKLMVHAKKLDENFWRDSASRAIIAWYIGDDTSINTTPSELYANYRALKDVDQRRIITQADGFVGVAGPGSSYSMYARSTDNFQPEIYPIKRGSADEASNCVAEVIVQMRGIAADIRRFGGSRPKSVWPLMQYFDGWGWQRFPTKAELYAMSFAALTEGGNGILWYTYGKSWNRKLKIWNRGITAEPEFWETMKGLSTWIAELSPVLLERTGAQPPAPTILAGPKTAPYDMPTISYLLKEQGDVRYLLAVNAAPAAVKAEFQLDSGTRAQVQREHRELTLVDGRLTDDFAPFAVHVYEIR